jgi:hypothetical protein
VSGGRYAGEKPRVFVAPDGVRVRYLAPRILPMPASPTQVTRVGEDERGRLDLVAQRTLRNPLLAWRIADANAAMDPFALVAVPGTLLAIPPVTL